jgi:hypothetical protein
MQLVEIDSLDAKITQAALDGAAQMRLAIVSSHARTLRCCGPAPGNVAFRRNNQAFWIGRQSIADEPFIVAGTIDIGGIDEIDPQLNDAPEYGLRRVEIARGAPNAGPGQPHCTESQTTYRHFTANAKLSNALQVHSAAILSSRCSKCYKCGVYSTVKADMLISEFVRRTGLARETVRYYVRFGLLQPQATQKGGRHPISCSPKTMCILPMSFASDRRSGSRSAKSWN